MFEKCRIKTVSPSEPGTLFSFNSSEHAFVCDDTSCVCIWCQDWSGLATLQQDDQLVETDRPSRPFQLHGPSRSGASYMLQIILWTNRDILDCPTILYTLSLYGNMLIIAIIVLSSSQMHAIVLFFCAQLLYDRTSLLFH